MLTPLFFERKLNIFQKLKNVQHHNVKLSKDMGLTVMKYRFSVCFCHVQTFMGKTEGEPIWVFG
jgi:hypothetical protein